MIDWVITNIGGTLMGLLFLYIAIRLILDSLVKLACNISDWRLKHG